MELDALEREARIVYQDNTERIEKMHNDYMVEVQALYNRWFDITGGSQGEWVVFWTRATRGQVEIQSKGCNL